LDTETEKQEMLSNTNSPRRTPLRGRHSIQILLLAGITLLIGGCVDERSQSLEERLTQMEKQLSESHADLQRSRNALATANDEIARLKKGNASAPPAAAPKVAAAPPSTPPPVAAKLAAPPPSTPPPAPTPEAVTATPDQLKEGYAAGGKALMSQLKQSARGFALEGCTLHRISLQRESYPVSSHMSLRLRSDDGRQWVLDVPVKATARGQWLFPTPTEVLAMLSAADSKSGAPSTADNRGAPQQVAPQQQMQPSSGTERTATIQWPDSQPRQGNNPPPAAQAPQKPAVAAPPPIPVQPVVSVPKPTASSVQPAQGVKSDKEVTIEW